MVRAEMFGVLMVVIGLGLLVVAAATWLGAAAAFGVAGTGLVACGVFAVLGAAARDGAR